MGVHGECGLEIASFAGGCSGSATTPEGGASPSIESIESGETASLTVWPNSQEPGTFNPAATAGAVDCGSVVAGSLRPASNLEITHVPRAQAVAAMTDIESTPTAWSISDGDDE